MSDPGLEGLRCSKTRWLSWSLGHFQYVFARHRQLYAGTRPPKNGISAWLSVCGRLEVKNISAPAVSLSRRGDPSRSDTRRAIAGAGSIQSTGHGASLPAGPATADSGCRRARRCRCDRVAVRQSRARARPRYRSSLYVVAAQRRFAPARRVPPSRPASLRSPARNRRSAPGVFALDGALGAQHRHALGLRTGAGRLDGRHGADERHGVGARADATSQAWRRCCRRSPPDGAWAAIKSPTSGTTRAMICSSLWWP